MNWKIASKKEMNWRMASQKEMNWKIACQKEMNWKMASQKTKWIEKWPPKREWIEKWPPKKTHTKLPKHKQIRMFSTIGLENIAEMIEKTYTKHQPYVKRQPFHVNFKQTQQHLSSV